MRVPFNIVGKWKLPLDVLHLPKADGGHALWMPDAYLLLTHASTFWRYLQQLTRFGLLQRNVLRDWLAYKGIVHTVAELPLLQLSPCAIRGGPWLTVSRRSLT